MTQHRQSWLAAALITLVLGGLWPAARVQPLNSYDQLFYLGIAYDLRHHNSFTDGFGFQQTYPDGARPPGMRFVPLYPALLAAAATIDPQLAAGMDCQIQSRGRNPDCPRDAPSIRGAQFVMAILFYLMLWWLGRAVTGSTRTAWLSLAIGLLTGSIILRSVNYLMTETTSLFLATATLCCAVAATRSPRPAPWSFACGLALGLTALTRPAFLYLFYAALAAAVITALRQRRHLTLVLLFAAGFALPVAPWILRNAIELGHASLSYGYDSHTLVQRISFDAMTWREYGLSYLCWLPDGSGMGKLLIGQGACDRFGWDERPDTFYSIGIGPLLDSSLAAAGGYDHHLGYLLRTYTFANPIKHALVTIPLALRGAWIDHYWGLILAPICLWQTLRSPASTRFLLLALPAWFMLLFNAAVAVNQERYNLLLIPGFAIAGAMLGGSLWQRRQPRLSELFTLP